MGERRARAAGWLVGVVALGAVLSGPTGSGAPGEQRSVTMTGFSPGQEAIATWALGLFAEAGLDLPPIDFVRHPTTASCRGREGMHTATGGRSTVHICTDEVSKRVELLYVHELAHAWDHGSLTDDRRGAFLELQGLRQWRVDTHDGWYDSGAEQAAETVVWALMDRPIEPARLRDGSCESLRAGYSVLAGRPPLHGYTDYC